MKRTQDLAPGLERHSVDAEREPSSFSLAAVGEPSLEFEGEGVEEGTDGCTVSLGSLPALGERRCRLRVENLTQQALYLALTNPLPWLDVWFPERTLDLVLDRGGGAAELELIFRCRQAAEASWKGIFEIAAEMESGAKKSFPVEVRAQTHLSFAMGDFDFAGSALPTPYDFGLIDPVATAEGVPGYLISIASPGKEPLIVTFQDLPDWLTFEESGYPRKGPAPGKFFERQAPLAVRIRPTPFALKFGPQAGRIILRSNDTRPAYQEIPLEFQAQLAIDKPHVTIAPPARIEVVHEGVSKTEIALSNWGKIPAHLSLESGSPALFLESLPEVPAASDSLPGRAILRATISAHSLSPGSHRLPLSLRVDNGLPDVAGVNVEVNVVQVLSRPATLDFGTVSFGALRRRHIRFKATGGRQLSLAARPLPESAGNLRVLRVSGHSIFVACQPVRPSSRNSIDYAGPGFEIVDESLSFRREIFVRFRAEGPWRRRFMMFSLVLLVLLVITAILLAVGKAL